MKIETVTGKSTIITSIASTSQIATLINESSVLMNTVNFDTLQHILIDFTVIEHQTLVGSITEEGSSFALMKGAEYFDINTATGEITFKEPPSYVDAQSYQLYVLSSKNVLYNITVHVTDYLSNTEILYGTNLLQTFSV